MPEYDCMGNVKILVDGTLDEIEIKEIYFNELLEQEELKLESFKKLKDPSKCEIKSKRKRVIKTIKYDDVKLPKKLRNGWK